MLIMWKQRKKCKHAGVKNERQHHAAREIETDDQNQMAVRGWRAQVDRSTEIKAHFYDDADETTKSVAYCQTADLPEEPLRIMFFFNFS